MRTNGSENRVQGADPQGIVRGNGNALAPGLTVFEWQRGFQPDEHAGIPSAYKGTQAAVTPVASTAESPKMTIQAMLPTAS